MARATVARFGALKLNRAWAVATQAEKEALLRQVAPEAVPVPVTLDNSPEALDTLLREFVAQARVAGFAELSSEALDRRKHQASEIKRRIDALCGVTPAADGVAMPSSLLGVADES